MMQVAGMRDYSATFHYKVQPKKAKKKKFESQLVVPSIYITVLTTKSKCVCFGVFVKLPVTPDIRPGHGELRRRPAGRGSRRFRSDGVLP